VYKVGYLAEPAADKGREVKRSNGRSGCWMREKEMD
jgi:hypothetical protein